MCMKTNRQEAIDDGFFSHRQEDKIYILECTTASFIYSEWKQSPEVFIARCEKWIEKMS